MECALDAQSLISISLMKIHNSRTQRGGIKLHKNLLVSCVLRNARQVYIKEIHRRQRYQEGIQQLHPRDADEERVGAAGGDEEAASRGCSARRRDATPPAALDRTERSRGLSCCVDTFRGSRCDHIPAHCNKTTVLDLDTHVVTTVENRYLHQDCCWDPLQPEQSALSPAKKRKVQFGCCPSEAQDVSDSSPKRAKREDFLSNPDCSDTSNISSLISIFGSGFSGLLSRHTDLDQVCSKQVLASLGAWSRAIVAF